MTLLAWVSRNHWLEIYHFCPKMRRLTFVNPSVKIAHTVPATKRMGLFLW